MTTRSLNVTVAAKHRQKANVAESHAIYMGTSTLNLFNDSDSTLEINGDTQLDRIFDNPNLPYHQMSKTMSER